MNMFALTLPIYNGEVAEAKILAALIAAQDISSPAQPLFPSGGVQRGTDAEIWDAFFTSPQPNICPCIFLQDWTENEYESVGGHGIHQEYYMSFYLIYYFGNLSTDLSYVPSTLSFTQQRRRHIQAVLKSIEMDSGGTSGNLSPRNGWKWDVSRPTIIDYTSPFKYFGKSGVSVNGDYNCVRIDKPVSIWPYTGANA